MTKRKSTKPSTEKSVRDIRRTTRRKYSAEEKIRIVMEGLRAEDSIAELCRKEGINTNVYYRWSGEIRNWDHESIEKLNPTKESLQNSEVKKAA